MDTKILEQLEETFAEEISLAGNALRTPETLVKEKMWSLVLQRNMGSRI